MDLKSGAMLFTAITSALLGVFVFLQGPKKRPNQTLALFSLGMALWCFGQFMGGIYHDKGLVLWWTRAGLMGAVLVPVFFLHFILSLTGQEQNKRGILIACYIFTLCLALFDLTPLFVANVAPVLNYSFYPQPGMLYPVFALFLIFCFSYSFITLFIAHRKAYGSKRNQLLYVLLAALIGFSGGITAFFPVWAMDLPELSNITLPLYLLITIYAIVKHNLLDISVVIRESLVYSLLTIIFSGFYALVVLSTNYLLIPLGFASQILTIFAAILVFQPLKDRVQRIVDRIFFRGEFRFQKAIEDLSQDNKDLMRGLLQADKLASLGAISAGLAHEIKNPLASLKGMTQVLDENLSDPKFIKNYQEMVCRQIDRINSLVEKMLRIGKQQGLSLKNIKIGQIINDTVSLVDSQLKKNGIEIKINITDEAVIEADQEQLSQVFLNLLLNAMQAMPNGGKIMIRSKIDPSGKVVIEFIDTGKGIAEDQINKIFDPFFTTKEQGTGMGLAVVYRIIKEHKGEIRVESKLGQGTKFIIWLPIRSEE